MLRDKGAGIDETKVSIVCLPAQHWSMTSEEDVNRVHNRAALLIFDVEGEILEEPLRGR